MTFLVREARPETDAEKTIRYVKRILSEPDHNMRRDADEFTLTPSGEAEFMRECHESPNSLFLVAEANNDIIGMLTLKGGHLRAEQHVAELGISVDEVWRGKGVGTALMDYALDWARNSSPLKRIALFVFARNTGAVRMYERYGFQIEGRLRRDMYRNGVYLDTLLMGLLLEDEPA